MGWSLSKASVMDQDEPSKSNMVHLDIIHSVEDI